MNLYTNRVELTVLIICWGILFLYLFRLFGLRKAIFHALVILPPLFFSTNMLCDAVTVDEWNYFETISDLKNVGLGGSTVGQVRFSKIIFGTFFRIIPDNIKSKLTIHRLYQIYKAAHYFLLFVITLLTSWLWKEKILSEDKTALKWRIMNDAILVVILGLPISCLFLKTCNYDTYVYLTLLSFSFMIAAMKRDDFKLAFGSVIAAVFGCLEKMTALPYWCVVMVFFIYMLINKQNIWYRKISLAVFALGTMAGTALGCSALSVVWVRMISNAPISISAGELFIPFVQMIEEASKVNKFSVFKSYCAMFLFLLCVILIASFIVDGISRMHIRKIDAVDILYKVNGACLGVFLIAGIVSTFLVTEYKHPYRTNIGGEYLPSIVFNGNTSYYGAGSKVGHLLLGCAYAYATIVCNYPTIVLFLLFAGVFILLTYQLRKTQVAFCTQFLLLVCIWLPVFEILTGQPSVHRYYGVTILGLPVLCLYVIYERELHWKRSAVLSLVGVVCVYLEMLLYIPNYNIFSPVWVIRPVDFNNTVRKGELRAGEALSWGEDFAIAGHMIQQMVDEEGIYDYENVTIHSNYTTMWLKNPGFQIGYFNALEYLTDCAWDDTEYFVLSKSMLYRLDLPEIINNIKPVASISYCGEISTWIYKGNQLAEYQDYIRQQIVMYNTLEGR